MKTQIRNLGMKTTIARVLLIAACATMTLAVQPHAAAQTVELFRNAGGDIKDWDGTAMQLAGGRYFFRNTGKNKIIKLVFTFDPVEDATGTSTVNADDQYPFLAKADKGKTGYATKDKDKDNKNVIGLTFDYDRTPIGKKATFGLDISGFGAKKVTMTATIAKQLIELAPSATSATAIPGVTSLSINVSGLANGNVSPANVRVEVSSVCLDEALATTSATSIASGDGDSKFVSFVLPAGLDPGQYYISISDSKEGNAGFESANCAAVTLLR